MMGKSFSLDVLGLQALNHATLHLRDGFDVNMSRNEAQANVDARALLINCANRIFGEHGCPITREEIEGAAIIEREMTT